MKSDSLFYTLFQTLPETLFMLAGEDASKATGYRFQSVEVKDHAFRLDGVLALPNFTDVFFFVEVQYQRDKRFYTRLFAEIMIFLYQHSPKGKWRVVVIFPNRRIDTGLPDSFEEYRLSGRLKIIYLSELSQGDVSSYPLNLLNLINLPPRKSEVVRIVQSVLKSAQESVKEIEKQNDIERLVSAILAAKFPNLSFEEIRTMIEPTLRGFEQTRFYQDILNIGKSEGIKKGIKKGIEKGKREEQQAIARNLLKLGLPTEVIAQATGLNPKEIAALQITK